MFLSGIKKLIVVTTIYGDIDNNRVSFDIRLSISYSITANYCYGFVIFDT